MKEIFTLLNFFSFYLCFFKIYLFAYKVLFSIKSHRMIDFWLFSQGLSVVFWITTILLKLYFFPSPFMELLLWKNISFFIQHSYLITRLCPCARPSPQDLCEAPLHIRQNPVYWSWSTNNLPMQKPYFFIFCFKTYFMLG